jgi:hypothetical protein
MQGNITSAGLAAPAAARYPIIEVAINVNPEMQTHKHDLGITRSLS